MAFQDDYKRSEVPDGVLAFVPPTVVPDGETIGITPSHRLAWITIFNISDEDALICASEEAFADSIGVVLPAGGALTLSASEAARRIVIGTPGSSDSGIQAVMALTRSEFAASHPELTVENGFPAFDNSDTDNIVPGVGLAT